MRLAMPPLLYRRHERRPAGASAAFLLPEGLELLEAVLDGVLDQCSEVEQVNSAG